MPRLTIAVVLVALVVLASTMTYAGFLAVGVLAELLGTGRLVAGLLLGVLFARFPSISKGKLRTVGLLPKPVRRPVMLGLAALCLWRFLSQGEYVPALFIGLATVFVVAFPWIRRAVSARLVAAFRKFAGRQQSPSHSDPNVIDGECREKKD